MNSIQQISGLEGFVRSQIDENLERGKFKLHFSGNNPFYISSVLVLRSNRDLRQNLNYSIEKINKKPILIAHIDRTGLINTKAISCNFDVLLSSYLESELGSGYGNLTYKDKVKYFLEALRFYYTKYSFIHPLLLAME